MKAAICYEIGKPLVIEEVDIDPPQQGEVKVKMAAAAVCYSDIHGIVGDFMDPASIVMITAPLFFPLVRALGYDTIWFAVLSLMNIQLGLITPPFGLDVFTMKAIAPTDVTLGDVFKSSMPFLLMGIGVMVLILFIPSLATWLPGMSAK